MLFESYQVFFEIVLFAFVFVGCRWIFQKGWLNNCLLLIGNLFILSNITTIKSLCWLITLLIPLYAIGKLLQKNHSRILLAACLSCLIVFFSFRNYPLLQDWLAQAGATGVSKHLNTIEKIGLSYILFRVLHWLVECKKGHIRSSDFVSFFNYIFFFPTFLAGPIDQYDNFRFYLFHTRVRLNGRMALAGVTRIFIGAVKTLLIVPLLLPFATDYQTITFISSPMGAFWFAAFLYSFYIYIDFSGYCDIAIGMAYILGIRTPENFRSPYLSTNIADFWKRWHITFSTFLKTYVFKPFIHLLNRFSIRQYRLAVSVCAYLVTFGICGLWHGCTLNFVLWGLWHGVGLSIYKILKQKDLQFIQKIPARLQKCIGVAVTFVFVTIGWVFFNYSVEELHGIAQLFIL